MKNRCGAGLTVAEKRELQQQDEESAVDFDNPVSSGEDQEQDVAQKVARDTKGKKSKKGTKDKVEVDGATARRVNHNKQNRTNLTGQDYACVSAMQAGKKGNHAREPF